LHPITGTTYIALAPLFGRLRAAAALANPYLFCFVLFFYSIIS
jgi:hypothetical protein